MNDIDLIPPEYHKKRLFLAWLKKAGLILLLVSSLFIGSSLLLRIESDDIQQQIEQLQSRKAITSSYRQQLEELNQQQKDLNQQLKLLAGLRSGAAAEQMFITIDRALPEKNVWITDWKFRRAGTPVENVNESVNTGYFIVIPQGAGSNKTSPEETWKIETQMTIQGQSLDHSGLSEFVLNLTQQPEIEDVSVVSTQLTERYRMKLVDFKLEIVVSALQKDI